MDGQRLARHDSQNQAQDQNFDILDYFHGAHGQAGTAYLAYYLWVSQDQAHEYSFYILDFVMGHMGRHTSTADLAYDIWVSRPSTGAQFRCTGICRWGTWVGT